MPAKPNVRNWKDVQTAIATVAIVTALGMWDLFAAPTQTEVVQAQEPILPPTEPPTELPVAAEPTPMTPIKIMFTPAASQTSTVVQQSQIVKKKKKDNNNNNGGGGSVTQTQSS